MAAMILARSVPRVAAPARQFSTGATFARGAPAAAVLAFARAQRRHRRKTQFFPLGGLEVCCLKCLLCNLACAGLPRSQDPQPADHHRTLRRAEQGAVPRPLGLPKHERWHTQHTISLPYSRTTAGLGLGSLLFAPLFIMCRHPDLCQPHTRFFVFRFFFLSRAAVKASSIVIQFIGHASGPDDGRRIFVQHHADLAEGQDRQAGQLRRGRILLRRLRSAGTHARAGRGARMRLLMRLLIFDSWCFHRLPCAATFFCVTPLKLTRNPLPPPAARRPPPLPAL